MIISYNLCHSILLIYDLSAFRETHEDPLFKDTFSYVETAFCYHCLHLRAKHHSLFVLCRLVADVS